MVEERDWADEAADKIASELGGRRLGWGNLDDELHAEVQAAIAKIIREAAAAERTRDRDPER